MCEGYDGGWCEQFDAHAAADAHDFCIRHQIAWCRLCERQGCPDCRRDRRLGEPDEDDDEADEE